jgi:predicted transcriptional regulator
MLTHARHLYPESEVHFSAELEAKLNRLATENGGGADEYVQHIVEHYLDHDKWFRQKVKKSFDRLDRGEFLTHDEVGARIHKMFRS